MFTAKVQTDPPCKTRKCYLGCLENGISVDYFLVHELIVNVMCFDRIDPKHSI